VNLKKLGPAIAVAVAFSSNVSEAQSASVQLAVIATPHDADATSSEVRVVTLDTGASRALGVLRHPPGAVVRGDTRSGAVFVITDEDDPGDRSWGAALYRVDGAGVHRLAAGVGHARRPLASADGWVYVERGAAGPDPTDGRLRVDDVNLDAVDPATGAIRAVYTFKGYALHLAGEQAGSLLVYRVGPQGAEVISLDARSGALKSTIAVPPFARDFSVDDARRTMVFADRRGDAWTVERLDLATFTLTTLSSDPDQQCSPLALVDGSVARTAPRRGGLWIGGKVIAPLGAGFDAPLASTDDGAWLSVLHVPGAGMDETYALQSATLRMIKIGGVERIDAVGFLGAGRGGVR